MIRWFSYNFWYSSQIKLVAILYTFSSVFSEFLPVYERQEQKSYQKWVSFLPSHLVKEMWLYWQTFNLNSAILIRRLNLMVFPNGSLIKLILVISLLYWGSPLTVTKRSSTFFILGKFSWCLPIVMIICWFAFRSTPWVSLAFCFPRLPC